MTPLELQDEMAAELKKLFSNFICRNSASEDDGVLAGVNIYTQDIPVPETDSEETPIPYIIVRLESGQDDGTRDSFNTVSLLLVIGVWDNEADQQGYRDAMNIIQRIYHRFHKNPNLNGKAVYAGNFRWAVQDDSYYPYFFAACNLNFHIAAVRKEDRFA